jgi:hypothetical protein
VYWGRESHESYPKPGIWPRILGVGNDLTDNVGPVYKPDAVYWNVALNDPNALKIRKVYAAQYNVPLSDIQVIPPENPGPLWQYFVGQPRGPGGSMTPSQGAKCYLPETCTPEEASTCPDCQGGQIAAECSAFGSVIGYANLKGLQK